MHELIRQTLTNSGFLFNFGYRPKLDTSPPPTKKPPNACFGNYCMRATVEKLNSMGEVSRIYKGYSENMNISDEVDGVCELRRRDGEHCQPAKLMFLRDIPNCNGIITEYDKDDNVISIINHGNTA